MSDPIHQQLQDLQNAYAKLKNSFDKEVADHLETKAALRKLTTTQDAAIGRAAELETQTHAILKYFFDRADDIRASDITRQFRLQISVVDYHIDSLIKRKLIIQTVISQDSAFQITGLGRDTIMRGTA